MFARVCLHAYQRGGGESTEKFQVMHNILGCGIGAPGVGRTAFVPLTNAKNDDVAVKHDFVHHINFQCSFFLVAECFIIIRNDDVAVKKLRVL